MESMSMCKEEKPAILPHPRLSPPLSVPTHLTAVSILVLFLPAVFSYALTYTVFSICNVICILPFSLNVPA